MSPQTCKRDGRHESYLSGAADVHRQPPPQAANQFSWRKDPAATASSKDTSSIGLQTIEHPARFRDSWQDRYLSTRLVIRGLPLDWSGSRNPLVSRHNHYILISLALDRGRFLPDGARFAHQRLSADSQVVCCRVSRRPGVVAGKALLLFLTISRFGCRDAPSGANRSMSARGQRSGFLAHPWSFHERQHNVRARLEI